MDAINFDLESPKVETAVIDETLYDSRPAGYGTEASRSGHLVLHKTECGSWKLNPVGVGPTCKFEFELTDSLISQVSDWELVSPEGVIIGRGDINLRSFTDLAALFEQPDTLLLALYRTIDVSSDNEVLRYKYIELQLAEIDQNLLSENNEDAEIIEVLPIALTSFDINDDGEYIISGPINSYKCSLFKFKLDSRVIPRDKMVSAVSVVFAVAHRTYSEQTGKWLGDKIVTYIGGDAVFTNREETTIETLRSIVNNSSYHFKQFASTTVNDSAVSSDTKPNYFEIYDKAITDLDVIARDNNTFTIAAIANSHDYEFATKAKIKVTLVDKSKYSAVGKLVM